jgi:hypothetical protein
VLSPLERANLNRWSSDLKHCILYYLEFQMMDKFRKASISEHICIFHVAFCIQEVNFAQNSGKMELNIILPFISLRM